MTPRSTLGSCRVHILSCERNPLIMMCSHCPINDSCVWLHIVVYLAVMLQTSWRTTEGS